MTGESEGEHERSGEHARTAPEEQENTEGEHESFSAATIERMQGFIDEHGYLSWLGVELRTASPGRAVMELPYRGELTNPGPEGTASTHGGIPATLIDTSSGFALRTTFDDPARAALTTTDLDVSYLRPATADLRVEATVARAGDSIGVTRASVTSVAPEGERKEVAIGTATYRLFRGRAEAGSTNGETGSTDDEADTGGVRDGGDR